MIFFFSKNLDALGAVAVKSIEFSMQTETPFVNLTVPKNYLLNNYKVITDSQYVSKYDNRINKLRKGAEDELIQVDIKTKKSAKPIVEKKQNEFLHSTQSFANQESPLSIESSSSGPEIIDVEVPSYLTEPIQYPPMHIFVNLKKKTLKHF
jgi:hypothetical protein